MRMSEAISMLSMSDEVIVSQCSPTMAGLKTGNMFSVQYSSKTETVERIRGLNRRLAPCGLRMLPLRYMKNRVLVYMYSPKRLNADLAKPQTRQLLGSLGYDVDCADGCIAQLCRRMVSGEAFPHEVGLFLGYPVEDVRGFIENKAEGFKFSGLWKVYGDVNAAKMRFESFEKCTRDNCRKLKSGCSLEQLISQ